MGTPNFLAWMTIFVTVWLALAPDERVIEIEAGEVELSASS